MVVLFVYADPLKKKIVYFLLFYTIMAVSELAVLFLMLLLSNGKPFSEITQSKIMLQTGTIFTKSLAFCIIEEIHIRLKKFQGISIPYKKELAFIMLYNLSMFFVLLYLLTTNTDYMYKDSTLLLGVASSVLFISLVASILIIQITKRSRQEIEYKLRLQQMEMQIDLNEDMARILNQLRSFRHDMNNHFSLMLGLLKDGDYASLNDYLSDIINDTSDVNNYMLLDNKALTIVLNNKYTKAVMNNVEFKSQIEVQTLPLPDMEICTLLGNILDNAIEAASQVDDNPYLYLQISKRKNHFLIECDNPYKVRPIEKNNHFVTTKVNKEFHGMGLENIKNIVRKYDGELEISYDTIFHIRIYLSDSTIQ